jgi:electron transfer flavoprotein alpha subunit
MLRNTSKFFGKSLVIGEASGANLSNATLSAITAAKKCGPVSVLIAGSAAKDVAANAAKAAGVDEVIAINNAAFDNGLAENWGPLIAEQAGNGFSHVFCGCTAFGKTVLARAAGKLDVMPIPDITAVVSEDTFVRLLYAGNAVNTVKSKDKIKLVSVRATAFDRAASTGGSGKVTEGKTSVSASAKSKFVERIEAKSDKISLEAAATIVSGGRGLKTKEQFWQITELLAKKLPNSAIGATRAVVDAEWCPYDMQIGQTGKIVAPQLYIAIGVSGAIQHAAGMKDSKKIVAINTDNECPMVTQLADYSLIEDAFKAVPAFAEKL